MAESGPEDLELELRKIVTDLVNRHPGVPQERIEERVRAAAGELVASARISTYLPIFIRRGAEARIRESQHAG